MPDPWPDDARQLLADLLLTGPPAIAVIESLDQCGLLVRVLPEWEPVRSRPQRNAYHRFTVDRHLVEAAVEASALADRVSRPDLLVVGALLHDIGKGYPGDHTEVGIDLVDVIGTRMGYPPEDVAKLVDMVRHHLLLPDVATRRDLSEASTIQMVADKVGSLPTLELLGALTEADSIATGPAAWGSWKAELVEELVSRTAVALGGTPREPAVTDTFPTDEHLALLEDGQEAFRAVGDTLTLVTADRPGLFSKVAGVLALSGLDVMSAAAHSSDNGMALEVFRVESATGPAIAWDRVERDLEQALTGKLALTARLAERGRLYRKGATAGLLADEPRITVDNESSATATVLEVQALDVVGVLAKITGAIADLALDLRSAKVQTLGDEVVDAFYLLGADGKKITDAGVLRELELAIRHALQPHP